MQPSKFTLAVANCRRFCQSSIFIVIILAKKLQRWSFTSKIYIQFTIFNTYFSAKLSFTNKRYHLHVLEKCLYVLQEVRSIVYFRQFIHPLSLHLHGNGTSFAFTSYNHCISEILWYHIFKQLLFSFILLPFVHLPAPNKNKTYDIKQKLFI